MAFRVLIAGGGVAALEAALALRADAPGLVDVEVLAPDADFVYRPLATAAPFHSAEPARFPLRLLVEEAGAQLRPGRLAAVDADAHRVSTDAGRCSTTTGSCSRSALSRARRSRGRSRSPAPDDEPALARSSTRPLNGSVERLVFAVPSNVGWPLPGLRARAPDRGLPRRRRRHAAPRSSS